LRWSTRAAKFGSVPPVRRRSPTETASKFLISFLALDTFLARADWLRLRYARDQH
jgi:hypothetical protein